MSVFGETRPGSEAGDAAQRIAWMTVVDDLYGVRHEYYYDKVGQMVMSKVYDGALTKVTSVNYNRYGDVTGIEHPLGDRVCMKYDARGNVTESRTYPTAGSHDAPIVQRYSFTPGLSRLAAVYDPRNPATPLQSFTYTPDGRLATSTDALNHVTTYSPTAWGEPGSLTGPDHSITTLTYNDSGQAEDVTVDVNGAALHSQSLFDAAGRPIFGQTPLGATNTWTYDGPRLSTMASEADGRTVTSGYGYNGTGQVSSVQVSAATGPQARTDVTFDLFGQVARTKQTALVGNTPGTASCVKRGPGGQVLATLGPEGEYATYEYNADGEVLTVRSGSPTTSEAWMDGCVTSSQALDPVEVGLVFQATYDANGRIQVAFDGRQKPKRFYYDGFNRVIRVVDADGNETRRGYDPMGNVAWEAVYGAAGPSGPLPDYRPPSISDSTLLAVAEYSYDANARLSTVNRWHFDENRTWVGDGRQTTTYAYDDVARKMTVTDDAGYATVTEFDGAGRISRRTLPTGDFESFAYTVGPNHNTVTKTWSAPTPSGRRSEVTKVTSWGAPQDVGTNDLTGAAVLVHYDYDNQFRVESVNDLVTGGHVGFGYDAFGRQTTNQSVLSASSSELVTLVYDRSGRIREHHSAVASQPDAVTSYRFDVLGRPVKTDRPRNVSERLEYGAGNYSSLPSNRIDSGGSGTAFTYQPNGLLRSTYTLVATTSQSLSRTFDHDGAGRLLIAHDGGALASTADDIDTFFRWDSLGGKRREWNQLLGTSQTIAHTFDGRGLPTTSTLGPQSVQRSFDGLGRLSTLSLLPTAGSPTAQWTYAGLGGPQQRSYGNGITTAYTYDPLGRLERQTDASGSTRITDWRWEMPLDGVPRLAGITRGTAAEVSSVFRVDQGGRIVAEDHGLVGPAAAGFALTPNGTSSAADSGVAALVGQGKGDGPGGWGTGAAGQAWRSYSLDGRNNWLTRNAGVAALAVTPVISALDQYLGFGTDTAIYDGAGRLVDSAALDVTYDPLGEVQSVTTPSGTTSYRYDALGRRVAETANGLTTVYGFDGPSRTLRKVGGAAVEVTIDSDLDEHVVRVESSGARHFYHQGRDHSVYLSTSASGSPEEWYQYTAYGDVTILSPALAKLPGSAVGNRFGYQGQPFDVSTGLVDMRARFYRPAWGRFISPDPIGLMGGPNVFAFAGGAPLSAWDPSGLDYGDLGPGSPAIAGVPNPREWQDIDYGKILGNPPADFTLSPEEVDRAVSLNSIDRWQQKRWEDGVYMGLYARARWKHFVGVELPLQLLMLPVGELLGPLVGAGLARGGVYLYGLGREGLALATGRFGLALARGAELGAGEFGGRLYTQAELACVRGCGVGGRDLALAAGSDGAATGGQQTLRFAHGTSEASGASVEAGLNFEKAFAASRGGESPGSFFAHAVGPASAPGPGLQLAFEWGLRYTENPVVLIGELPMSVADKMIESGLLEIRTLKGGGGVPQLVFSPEAFPSFNESVRWITTLRF